MWTYSVSTPCCCPTVRGTYLIVRMFPYFSDEPAVLSLTQLGWPAVTVRELAGQAGWMGMADNQPCTRGNLTDREGRGTVLREGLRRYMPWTHRHGQTCGRTHRAAQVGTFRDGWARPQTPGTLTPSRPTPATWGSCLPTGSAVTAI